MIAGPLFLMILPLALAPVVYLLRRWALLAASLASATALIVASLCLGLSFDQPVSVLSWEVALGEPMVVLGREFALELAGGFTLGFVCLIATGARTKGKAIRNRGPAIIPAPPPVSIQLSKMRDRQWLER